MVGIIPGKPLAKCDTLIPLEHQTKAKIHLLKLRITQPTSAHNRTRKTKQIKRVYLTPTRCSYLKCCSHNLTQLECFL